MFKSSWRRDDVCQILQTGRPFQSNPTYCQWPCPWNTENVGTVTCSSKSPLPMHTSPLHYETFFREPAHSERDACSSIIAKMNKQSARRRCHFWIHCGSTLSHAASLSAESSSYSALFRPTRHPNRAALPLTQFKRRGSALFFATHLQASPSFQ